MIRMYRTLNYLEMYDATKVEAWLNPEQVRKLFSGAINRIIISWRNKSARVWCHYEFCRVYWRCVGVLSSGWNFLGLQTRTCLKFLSRLYRLKEQSYLNLQHLWFWGAVEVAKCRLLRMMCVTWCRCPRWGIGQTMQYRSALWFITTGNLFDLLRCFFL